MKKSSMLMILIPVFLTAACGSNNKTQTVSYETDEDKAEEQTLSGLEANLKLTQETEKDWPMLTLPEYQFSLRYPENLSTDKKDSPDYLSRYVFKETDKKNDDKAPLFELQILSSSFENTLKNMEKTMEINSKEQITLSESTVGVKLTGVENGQIVILFPVGKNTARLTNSSLRLEETFLAVVRTVEVK